MRVHVIADADNGLAHTISVTPANVADITELPNLLQEVARKPQNPVQIQP